MGKGKLPLRVRKWSFALWHLQLWQGSRTSSILSSAEDGDNGLFIQRQEIYVWYRNQIICKYRWQQKVLVFNLNGSKRIFLLTECLPQLIELYSLPVFLLFACLKTPLISCSHLIEKKCRSICFRLAIHHDCRMTWILLPSETESLYPWVWILSE